MGLGLTGPSVVGAEGKEVGSVDDKGPRVGVMDVVAFGTGPGWMVVGERGVVGVVLLVSLVGPAVDVTGNVVAVAVVLEDVGIVVVKTRVVMVGGVVVVIVGVVVDGALVIEVARDGALVVEVAGNGALVVEVAEDGVIAVEDKACVGKDDKSVAGGVVVGAQSVVGEEVDVEDSAVVVDPFIHVVIAFGDIRSLFPL